MRTTDCLLGGYYLEVNRDIIDNYTQIPFRWNVDNMAAIPIYIYRNQDELMMNFPDQCEKHNKGMGIDEIIKLLSRDYLLGNLPPYNLLFDFYIPITYSVPTNLILKRIK